METNTVTTPDIGTRVYLRHGPFVSIWELIALDKAGARFAHVGPVTFNGFEHTQSTPSGVPLTFNTVEEFIGAAHLPDLITVPTE